MYLALKANADGVQLGLDNNKTSKWVNLKSQSHEMFSLDSEKVSLLHLAGESAGLLMDYHKGSYVVQG